RHDGCIDDVEVLEAQHATALVDDGAERARADWMKETAGRCADVRGRVDLRPRPELGGGVTAGVIAGDQLPQRFESFCENLCVALVPQETVVDREGRVRPLLRQPYRPARARLHREGGC